MWDTGCVARVSRVSVRTRLLIATALPSFALMLTYLLGLPSWSLYIEDRVLINLVASQLNIVEQAALQGIETPVLPEQIVVYHGIDQLPTEMSEVLLSLEPGVHERVDDVYKGKVTDMFIGVGAGTDPADRVYVLLDSDGLESVDIRPATVLSVLAISAASLFLLLAGIALSRSVSRSVRALSALTSTDETHALETLPNDELGDVGRQWLRSRSELQQAADRQRRFARNVSHELRTPIAVASGAFELMHRHRPERESREAELLQRAESALGDMRELVEIFMGVAEGASTGTTGQHPFREVVSETVEDVQLTHDVSKKRLFFEAGAGGENLVPRISMAIVTRHILLNALRHAPADAPIAIEFEDDVLRVSNPLRPRDAADQPRRGGVGLQILNELVRSVGWSVSARPEGEQFVTQVAIDSRFNALSDPPTSSSR